ncbi:hypothetical protein FRB94_004901 [Tulasnella sp. JGI-2019a]|nr:hypothetical protein FRB94_004901 [Tulasnella sp. JGI-2019a]KAG9029928.1 hypothetical protein FRB95_004724 [Tulasnella sp. JGI-2019a]
MYQGRLSSPAFILTTHCFGLVSQLRDICRRFHGDSAHQLSKSVDPSGRNFASPQNKTAAPAASSTYGTPFTSPHHYGRNPTLPHRLMPLPPRVAPRRWNDALYFICFARILETRASSRLSSRHFVMNSSLR